MLYGCHRGIQSVPLIEMGNRKIEVTFSNITFLMLFDENVRITDSFQPFVHGMGQVTYQCFFQCVEKLPERCGRIVEQNIEYQIIQGKDGEYRVFIDHLNGDRPYSLTEYDWERRQIRNFYLPDVKERFSDTRTAFFHLGWEKVLIKEGRMLLHASCIDTSYGGLVFSGPSGMGKSTQADLWCRYAGAVQINGDRPVINKDNGCWTAWGSPYAGSSGCHVDKNCRIRAVFVLKQGSKNVLEQLKPSEAFGALYREMIVNSWDDEYVFSLSRLLSEFVKEIPVYRLQCTADPTAVDYLENVLGKGEADV